MARYKPILVEATRKLQPDEALEIRFRPEQVDVIVVRFMPQHVSPKPRREGEPGQLYVALLRPNDAIPVDLQPRVNEEGSLQYVMEEDDLLRPGEWLVRLVDETDVEVNAKLSVEYPGSTKLIEGSIHFPTMANVVQSVFRQFDPRFYVETGAWQVMDVPPHSEGFHLGANQVHEWLFDIDGAGTKTFATQSHVDPEFEPQPDPYEPEPQLGLSHRVEICVPNGENAWVSIFDRDFHGTEENLFQFQVNEAQAAREGKWLARVTSLDWRSGGCTIGRMRTHGRSRIDFAEGVHDSVHLAIPEISFGSAPFRHTLKIDGIQTRPASEWISVEFLDPPKLPESNDDFPLGAIEVSLRTGSIHDKIHVAGLAPDVDLEDAWIRAYIGFAIVDRKLTFKPIDWRVDVDIDRHLGWALIEAWIGVLSSVLAPLPGIKPELSLNALAGRVIADKLPDVMPKAIADAVGSAVAPALRPNAKVYDAHLDGDYLRLFYYIEGEDQAPAGRVRVPPPPPTLQSIKHLVVVLMENRSFDHMLGYLRLNGRGDIDGLRGDEANTLTELPEDLEEWQKLPEEAKNHYRSLLGQTRTVRPFPVTAKGEPVDDPTDLGHDDDETARQLANGNGGFANDFARRLVHEGRVAGDPWFPLVHQTAQTVPMYDFLAREFVVCNRWFSALPGPTQVNRLYAFAGDSNGQLENVDGRPVHDVVPVFEHLDQAGVDWRFYFHNVPSLWLVRGYLARQDRIFPIAGAGDEIGFAKRAAEGKLPPVTFLDPHLMGPPGAGVHNDDHAPTNVLSGQGFIKWVYETLRAGANWQDTLLLVTYDEHGGFYDHVRPPTRVPDNDAATSKMGVRVPALLISPRVRRGGVDREVYNHASIPKTILMRHCYRASDGTIPNMGKRVTFSAHFGGAIESEARDTPMHGPHVPPATEWPQDEKVDTSPSNWRTWVTRHSGGHPGRIPSPLIGLGTRFLAHDRLRGTLGGHPDLIAQLRAVRSNVNLVGTTLFCAPLPDDLPGDRVLPLFGTGGVNPEFVQELVKTVDAAARLEPPVTISICPFSVAPLNNVKNLPTNTPPLLRPDYSVHGAARFRDWFNPMPTARFAAQLGFLETFGRALAGRRNVIWQLLDAAVMGADAAAADIDALVGWLDLMRLSLRATAGADAIITIGTGPHGEPPNGHLSESLVLPRFGPDLFVYAAPQWLRAEFPAEGVRAALERARGWRDNTLLICSDANMTGTQSQRVDLATRASAVLRHGAGFVTRTGVDVPMSVVRTLGVGASEAAGRSHPYLVIYDITKSTRAVYRTLERKLRSYEDVQRVERSGWLLASRLSLEALTAQLVALVDHDDTLVVLPLRQARVQGRVSGPVVREWLRKRTAAQVS
jgi:phospholipase C